MHTCASPSPPLPSGSSRSPAGYIYIYTEGTSLPLPPPPYQAATLAFVDSAKCPWIFPGLPMPADQPDIGRVVRCKRNVPPSRGDRCNNRRLSPSSSSLESSSFEKSINLKSTSPSLEVRGMEGRIEGKEFIEACLDGCRLRGSGNNLVRGASRGGNRERDLINVMTMSCIERDVRVTPWPVISYVK